MEHIVVNGSVHTAACNIKGLHPFLCKSAYMSCVNGALCSHNGQVYKLLFVWKETTSTRHKLLPFPGNHFNLERTFVDNTLRFFFNLMGTSTILHRKGLFSCELQSQVDLIKVSRENEHIARHSQAQKQGMSLLSLIRFENPEQIDWQST